MDVGGWDPEDTGIALSAGVRAVIADRGHKHTERRMTAMRWLGVVTLAGLVLHGGSVAAEGGNLGLPGYSVSVQGIIREASPAAVRTSPSGAYRMETVVTKGGFDQFDTAVRVVSSDGASRRLPNLHGNALYVTDGGRVVTLETTESTARPSVLRVYDLDGRELIARRLRVPSDPTLASDGSRLACRTAEGLLVLDLATFHETIYPAFDLFALGPNEEFAGLVLADARGAERWALNIRIYERGRQDDPILLPVGAPPRRIKFSFDGSSLLILGPSILSRVDLRSGRSELLFTAPGGYELQDLRVGPGRVWVGLRRIEGETCSGALVDIGEDGRVRSWQAGPSKKLTWGDALPVSSRGIPWPILPNAQHPVGNTYGEYQNYGGAPYPHPGTDIMGSPAQEVYAVRGGVVKAILTTSGMYHWRIAVGDSATAGTCKGYLYAHLDQYSIAVNVGDPILPGQYLGDLVEWPIYGFTHCHFARIQDSGWTWDGTWLCTENAHLDLVNQTENMRPVFEPARGNDLLAFCEDQTSTYQTPTSLHGRVDIIAHVGDRIGSTWVCTVQEIRYTIYPVGLPRFPVVNNKQSVYFNMALDTYQGGGMDAFLIDLLYKQDGVCNTQGDYDYREFYHIITNSDGDQDYEESDLYEAWDTAHCLDGSYVVRVTAVDVAGNVARDSMTVVTANGGPSLVAGREEEPAMWLGASYPNPGRGRATIAFGLPSAGRVTLSIHDPMGRVVRRLIDEPLREGAHTVAWDGRGEGGETIAPGIYFWRLVGPSGTRTGKLSLIE